MDNHRRSLLRHLKLIILLLLLHRTLSESPANDDLDDELFDIIHASRNTSLWTTHKSRMARAIPEYNETQVSLWSELVDQCRTRTSFSCIKSGMFRYLDRSLEIRNDVEVSEDVFFRRNLNKYNGVCENSEEEKERCSRYYMERLSFLQDKNESNEIPGSSSSGKDEKEEGTSDDDILEGESRDLHGLADVTDILYDKGAQFLMTHDLELGLPKLFFGGGAIKMEPKGFVEGSDTEEEGVLVKLVFKPPTETEVGSGRFLHHIKKFFKKKLMHSFMALILIIKMIKVKLMFLLPMIVGQSTAKKLLLKALLFLIPGLAHLFKLCHYYHLEHAKYHHHHHKIKHHHHHVQVPVPVPVPVPVHHPHHPPVHHHVEPTIHHIHEDPGYPPYPPSKHHPHGGGGPVHGHLASAEEFDYPPVGNGGGGYGNYPVGEPSSPSHHRNEYQSMFSQFTDNEAAMTSWGLGSNTDYQETGVLDAKEQPMYYEKNMVKKSPHNPQYYPNANEYPGVVNQVQNMPNDYHPGAVNQGLGNNLKLLTPHPPPGAGTVPVVYDPFYSPILQKIDNVFVQLGFNEEACRERLVCSMYKNPQRYSPHSNLISAELSRDSRELQRPIINNSAVVRFYKYVQAARDGQDQKDCLRLYSFCQVNTEK